MKVVGIEEVKYTNKDGKEVHGYNVYGTYPSKRCLIGEKMGKEYVSAYLVEKHDNVLPALGDEFTVTYNRKGMVADYSF